MISLQNLEMKEATRRPISEKEVRDIRTELEKKTQNAYDEFDRSKRTVQEVAHLKILD